MDNAFLFLAGVDFSAFDGSIISVPQGSSRGCTTFSIFPDSIVEGDEVLGLSLSTNAIIDPLRSTATFIIVDDGKCSFSKATRMRMTFGIGMCMCMCVDLYYYW